MRSRWDLQRSGFGRRFGPRFRRGFVTNKILSYRDLVVWQKAMDLADLVYDR